MVFRSIGAIAGNAGVAALAACLAVGALGLVPSVGSSNWFGYFLVLVVLLAAARSTRIKVVTHEDHVEVHNYWRSYRIQPDPSADVRIGPSRHPGCWLQDVLIINTDSKRIEIEASCEIGYEKRGQLLNNLVTTLGLDAGPGSRRSKWLSPRVAVGPRTTTAIYILAVLSVGAVGVAFWLAFR